MTDDTELLRQYAVQRSEAAFGELVGRHVDFVYSAALRQMGGDHHRAQDVTQMVFTHLARKASAILRHPVLPAWLYRTTYLEAANTRRREGRRHRYELAAGAEARIAGTDDGAPAWERVFPVLDVAMNELNERDRRAILLRFFSNYSFAEVGRRLGLTENAARMRVERALAKLHNLLAQRGIASTSAALAAALSANTVAAAPAGVATAATTAALAGTGSGAAAWIVFMMSTKFPMTLTAALVLSGASVGIWQQQANHRAAQELADLSRQNRAITALRVQNQQLTALRDEALGLREEDENLEALRNQVREAESKVAAQRREAIAAAQARNHAANRFSSGRVLALVDGNTALDVSKLDQVPRLIKTTRPTYPLDLRQTGIPGQVIVDFVVGADGLVYNAHAVSSTASDFEPAAVQAVSQWTFSPGQKGGQPVNTHMLVPIVFTPNPTQTSDSVF
jgi:RNA polymerase sigma factor (sigma-70 family)